MRIVLFASPLFFAVMSDAAAAKLQDKGRVVEGIPVCGGFLGLVCPNTDWCDYPEGVACGGADHFGTCRKRPEICTQEFLPVCGCNGETFSNACQAAAAGFDVAHPGKCR